MIVIHHAYISSYAQKNMLNVMHSSFLQKYVVNLKVNSVMM